MKKQYVFAGLAIAALTTSMVACGSNYRDDNAGSTNGGLGSPPPMLNTRIPSYLEIDQLTPGCSLASCSPQDANLVQGHDGNSASNKAPGPGGDNYVDWTDLNPQNHRLMDTTGTKGQDPTSFPRSNECVGGSQVLSKMDLTYVAAANNSTYAYFGVQRSDNNGDAGYYWVLTKKVPSMDPGGPCKPGEGRLMYSITAGDVLIAGHFKPSDAPLVRVFKAKNDSAQPYTAIDAVDFNNAIWGEVVN